MNDMTCYLCDKQFEYHDEDVCTTNDIVEGQYVEYDIVMCTHCELSVKI